MSTPTHHYASHIVWEGNRGHGTSGYADYGRGYRVLVTGKPDLQGSAYEDAASAMLTLDPDGGGRFDEILLRPRVTVARAEDAGAATALHDDAHRLCFLARSCATPIRHAAIVEVAAPEAQS